MWTSIYLDMVCLQILPLNCCFHSINLSKVYSTQNTNGIRQQWGQNAISQQSVFEVIVDTLRSLDNVAIILLIPYYSTQKVKPQLNPQRQATLGPC